MNMPGGCVIAIDYGAPMVFVPSVVIVKEDQEQGGGFRLVSTVIEDMQKRVQPIRELIAMIQGGPGFVPPNPD